MTRTLASILAATGALLPLCLVGCVSSADAFPNGFDGAGGTGGSGSTGCVQTRCSGERSQCVHWLELDASDCEDGCDGTLDILGCLQSCYDLKDALIEGRCDADFNDCIATAKASECWDESDPQGTCVGTSEISCSDLGGKSACKTVPGCDPSGTYIETLGKTYWSCDGQPAACTDMKDAASCRALRCTWQ